MNYLIKNVNDQLKSSIKINRRNDAKRWYAIYVRSNFEMKVYNSILQLEIEVFVPLIKTIRSWADRKKRVMIPLIPGYVFVKLDPLDISKVYGIKGIVRFVSSNNVPLIIPKDQIDAVKIMISGNLPIELVSKFIEGEKVEITTGPLRGLKGTIQHLARRTRFIIAIDIINRSIAVEINPIFIKKIK